jgi:hypothetical protein
MPIPFAGALSSKLLRFASTSFLEAGFLIRDLGEFFANWGHNGPTISLEKKQRDFQKRSRIIATLIMFLRFGILVAESFVRRLSSPPTVPRTVPSG